MNKAIIVLDGISEGKTLFTELAKQHREKYPEGIWVWSINASNVLSVASRSMGWDGIKNDKYYEYLTKLMNLVNEYWDFKPNYFNQMIQKFNLHPKAQLLIIHGAGEDVEKSFKENEEEQEIYFVNLIRNKEQESDRYDINIIFGENFEAEVVKLFDVLVGESKND
jgi:hypothetical protein